MRLSSSLVRPLALVLLVVSVAGCSWFKKGAKGDYALAPEARPLEVPPDLNLPNTSGAMQVPAAGQVGPAAAPAAGGFNVAGSRDEAFTRVGEALAGVEGVTVASRAQLLGTYDVSYEGASFLVRVSAVEAGAYVSAVDPRGLPATSPAAVKLLAALKAKLGG
ncbi:MULTISPECIES: hypothetical protein [Pseudoxanthomonas]|uniref:Beta-barrel assembly machine subunit BamC n=1 Tax=Pseudoxanthomonas japonensis TaxID=69284 RepID=A0ABQ6ZKC8_9GAMM|nr:MULTISPECIES: hypothetical protein [Pseudoxanthomonas]KAF1726621.1 hypothetical protein CSC78_03450 [Pseudoxanthomonas japonensis]MCR6626958.1 hypothetical protein [Pseudoxanthomonas sp.]PZQ30431.1 MAG: hypothetical protein DI562_07150 [Stenotrophomonas acidaminiphila]